MHAHIPGIASHLENRTPGFPDAISSVSQRDAPVLPHRSAKLGVVVAMIASLSNMSCFQG